jgi:Tol biopolymer transport system component
VWSPDDRYIYFVKGRPPDDMDLWRIAVQGGEPERITFHASQVSHPVFLDGRTLLYLATDKEGAGPWLHAVDPERRVSRRLGDGMASHTALAASADGRRLVATRATRRTSLWRVPITGAMAREADARRVPLPAAGGYSPRLGPGYLLFVSPSDGSGLRRLSDDGRLAEVWKGGAQRLLAGPAIDPVGRRIAITTADGRRTRLQVMEADGSGRRVLAAQLQVRGAPAWTPDGRSVVVAAEQGQDLRLFRVPLDGAPATPLAADYSRDATWSPDGRFVVFGGPDVGPTFALQALSADARPRAVPNVRLPRGARRMVFLPGGRGLVVLKGATHDRNFWHVDLDTGAQRALTDFGPGFAIGDFDISADGREIVFDQQREESDVVRIDLAP